MNVDFSALDSLGNKTPAKAQKPATGQNTTSEGHTSKPQALNLSQLMDVNGQQPAGVENPQQENIQRAGMLRAEILKGVRNGESPTALFLKAAECIGLMTGDRIFYDQIKADVLTIWGDALRDPAALEMQLQETRERLQKLQQVLEGDDLTGDEKERLQKAVKQHKAKAENIEDALIFQ